MIVVGASAYPRVIDFARIRAIADEVGALMMTDMAHIAGLVAAGLHPSPVPHSHFVTTTTHKTLRGPRGGLILCQAAFAKELDRAVFPGVQGGPLMHVIAAKAVCFKEALAPAFRDYQQQIVKNAARLAAAMAAAGFRLVSGGTDTHLMLVDVFSRGMTGKVAEAALGRAGITVNKNTIPFDRNPPLVASGIRLGTPAVTTRGMREAEMDAVAGLIARVLAAPEDEATLGRSGVTWKRCAGGSRCIRSWHADRAGRRDVRCRRRAGPPDSSSNQARAARLAAAVAETSATAARCSPRPGPGPARPWHISCPQRSPVAVSSFRQAPGTCRIRSSTRTCPPWPARSASTFARRT